MDPPSGRAISLSKTKKCSKETLDGGTEDTKVVRVGERYDEGMYAIPVYGRRTQKRWPLSTVCRRQSPCYNLKEKRYGAVRGCDSGAKRGWT